VTRVDVELVDLGQSPDADSCPGRTCLSLSPFRTPDLASTGGLDAYAHLRSGLLCPANLVFDKHIRPGQEAFFADAARPLVAYTWI
jgi:hypothetical protein